MNLTSYNYNFNKNVKCFIGTETMNILNDELKKINFDKIFIISDDLVFSIWEKTVTNQLTSFEYDIILFKNGEKSKNINTYTKICSELFSKGATSKSLIIAFGGGVVGNLAGFISSTLYRGIKFIHIPTTVLSQADSVYGGKQAINFEGRKNIIGSIYEPEFILVDYNFLSTLPKREIKCGIAESIKHALCEDVNFLNEFENVSFELENIINLIEKTINIKLRLLEIHSKDKKSGKIMKYGHTLGHALESILDGEITHGEGVSIGMCFITYLMNKKGLLSEKDKNIHFDILKKWGLPTKIPNNLNSDLIIKQLEKDNSFKNNKISLIVLTKIGDIFSQNSFIIEVEKNEFEKILNDFISN